MTTPRISGDDLARAVAAGVIDQAAAGRLQDFLAAGAPEPGDSEDEHLRLISGFGDIFVAIGLVLFLGALAFLTLRDTLLLPSMAVAVAAWGLAELFTRMRRQALPSILLLIAFAGAVFVGTVKLLDGTGSVAVSSGFGDAMSMAGAGLVTSLAVALHWWRFRVPVTVAAGCAAATALVVGLVSSIFPDIVTGLAGLIFLPIGLAVFALAMRFDTSDRYRRSRNTDIAFWLHALAAPMIVHPVMQNIMQGDTAGPVAAVLTFAIFALLSFVALTVDRRAMLVSSLIYLGYAIYSMLRSGDAVPSTSVVVLLVGAVVLGLSLAWRPLRAALLKALPAGIAARVPPPHLSNAKSG